jgi:hypothetical protein
LNKTIIEAGIYKGSELALQDPPEKGNSQFRIKALEDIKNFIFSVTGK